MEVEKIISKATEQLSKGTVIATGIGVFAAIFRNIYGYPEILLRKRLEKESLIYSKDLSGKWELPGGTLELADFDEDYQGIFKNTLRREIKEETGLEIQEFQEMVLLPAVLKRSSIERLNLIDFAFVFPLRLSSMPEIKEHQEKLEKGEIQWIPVRKIDELQIVSERMKYLIIIAIKHMKIE